MLQTIGLKITHITQALVIIYIFTTTLVQIYEGEHTTFVIITTCGE